MCCERASAKWEAREFLQAEGVCCGLKNNLQATDHVAETTSQEECVGEVPVRPLVADQRGAVPMGQMWALLEERGSSILRAAEVSVEGEWMGLFWNQRASN